MGPTDNLCLIFVSSQVTIELICSSVHFLHGGIKPAPVEWLHSSVGRTSHSDTGNAKRSVVENPSEARFYFRLT